MEPLPQQSVHPGNGLLQLPAARRSVALLEDSQTESLSEYLSFNLAGQSYSVLLVNNTGYGEWLDSQSMHELESATVLILSTFSQTEAFRAYGAQYNQQVSAFLLIFQEIETSLSSPERPSSSRNRSRMGSEFL